MTDLTAPDVFSATVALVTLIGDPKGCSKRLDELQKLEAQIAKAQAKLDADRGAHDRAVMASRAELDEREAKLRKREVDLAGREGMLAHSSQVIAKWKAEHDFADADIQPGSTLRRARA